MMTTPTPRPHPKYKYIYEMNSETGIMLTQLSNIPASAVYGDYISQLIRYSRVCTKYSDFLDRAQLLTQKLLKQGYVAPRLMSSLQIFYSTIVITIELTAKTYPYLKLQWVFYFLRRCFLSSITAKTFTELDCLARRVSYEK